MFLSCLVQAAQHACAIKYPLLDCQVNKCVLGWCSWLNVYRSQKALNMASLQLAWLVRQAFKLQDRLAASWILVVHDVALEHLHDIV